MCIPTVSQPSSLVKSEISVISANRAARVSRGTNPTVRAVVAMSA